MRLIDANELETDICYARSLNKAESFYDYSYSEQQINNAPTVDAIPVAFIKEQMCKYENLAYNSIEKIQQRYFDKETALKSLINNWREKNGEENDRV